MNNQILPNGRRACKVTLSWADGSTYCNHDQQIRAELFTKLVMSLDLPHLRALQQVINTHILTLAEKDLLNREFSKKISIAELPPISPESVPVINGNSP